MQGASLPYLSHLNTIFSVDPSRVLLCAHQNHFNCYLDRYFIYNFVQSWTTPTFIKSWVILRLSFATCRSYLNKLFSAYRRSTVLPLPYRPRIVRKRNLLTTKFLFQCTLRTFLDSKYKYSWFLTFVHTNITHW